jgi:DNA (cytosine-5)-methyltransferase 1
MRGGVADFSYPTSTTRRGRVQDMGRISPTILTDTEICKVETEYRIRKLTPLETWRLMGFTDEDFYKAKQVNPDTKLYKQAGNSIVVNVLEAVFRQMIDVNEQRRTNERAIHEKDIESLKHRLAAIQEMGGDSD